MAADLPPIQGVHHTAFRCRDAEETRHFYEDVLGLELAAALAFDTEPGSGKPMRYMHLFFRLGDGRFVAFFDWPGSATPEMFDRTGGFDLHLALEMEDMSALDAYRERLRAHGFKAIGPVEHDFVRSVYCYDPNGIQVEVTVRTPEHDAILAEEQREARAIMAAWTDETRPAKAHLWPDAARAG
ncbi:MAG: VOC family protein [Rhodobacteraceae bacterium]|nr:VOC family protein [Paracoccaceae bacterium]